MLQHLKTYLVFGNRFCGLEHTLKNGEAIIYSTVLKKTKSKVDIDVCFSSKNIKEVANKLPKNQHVFLIINNEHVLTKDIENELSDDLKSVNRAFPNINISEFYYEIIQQDTKCFISICRKSYVDSLIANYTKLNISVINFSLGNSILSSSVNYIKTSSVFTTNALILIKDNAIDSINFIEETKEEQYDINGLHTVSLYVLSLSASLATIVNNYSSTKNFQEKKEELANVFGQIRFFNHFLKGGLVFILGLLLVNFLFFNFYFKKVDVLNETSQLNLTSKERIIKLSEAVNKAQKITDDMLKSSVSKSSFFVNALIQSLPESILLSEINYQPLKKNIKPDKGIELQNNVIIVTGASNNSSIYSEWITNLEQLDWIASVEVLDYSDSKSSSNFSIKIRLIP